MKTKNIFFVILTILILSSLEGKARETGLSQEEREALSIERVFDPLFVKKEATVFIDPIGVCEEMRKDQEVDEDAPDCGEFQMGSPWNEEGRDFRDERPHKVLLTERFEIQTAEATQLQWLIVMKEAPFYFVKKCDDRSPTSYRIERENGQIETVTICDEHPAETVSYNDIMREENGFVARLNASQNQYWYSLPSEARWEFTAKGGRRRKNGQSFPYSFGDDLSLLDKYAIYRGNSGGRTHKIVGDRLPNDYGVYDMHGNVREWTLDWYDKNYGLTREELISLTVNPQRPDSGSGRVHRGGSWSYTADGLRSASRYGNGEKYSSNNIGFRLVRVPR